VRRRPHGVGEGAALYRALEPAVDITPAAAGRRGEKGRLGPAIAFGVCLTVLAALWFLIPAALRWLTGLPLDWAALSTDSPQSGLYRSLEHLMVGSTPGDTGHHFDFDPRILLVAPLLGVLGFAYSFRQSGPPASTRPTAHGKLPNHGTKG
jgi:hypothetical protein